MNLFKVKSLHTQCPLKIRASFTEYITLKAAMEEPVDIESLEDGEILKMR